MQRYAVSEPVASAPGESRARRRATERRQHRRSILKIGSLVLVSLLVLAVGATLYASWRLNENISRVDIDKAVGTDRPTVATGPLNILLIGSDTRVGEGNRGYGDGSWEPGAHSDTNLLVHFSADREHVTVVSIPRDSMTPAPPGCSATVPRDQWTVRQWNQNYTAGGPGCLIRTLEGNTGIFINHFAVLDFGGFKDMVDALGGVPVCTKVAINDERAKLQLEPGRHVLNGEQALGYVRVRYTLGDGSDLGRIKRQQAFLSSVAQEATKTSLLLRPDKLYGFLDAATKSLTTDPAFDVGTMRDVAASVKNLGISKIKFLTVPTEAYAPDPNRVQWKESADLIWSAIREDREIGAPAKPTPTPAATLTSPLTVSPTKISVRVINASGVSGAARVAAQALPVQGFPSVGTGNAAIVTEPVIVRYSGTQAEAARTVAAAFPGARTERVNGLGTTIEVVLGKGFPAVAELPNRTGTEPLPSLTPSPSTSASIDTRAADEDICS